nr:hypothetical protein [Micromonospora sp. DSM 115978]
MTGAAAASQPAGVGLPAGVVDDPVDVTPEWMTAALRAGGTEATVASLHYDRVGTGQIGASYRFHLTYDGATYDSVRGGKGPATVVVKMAAGDPAERDIVRRGYQREVGFYGRFAGSLPVRTPRCWQAAISEDGRFFTLVLEDAHPARPG